MKLTKEQTELLEVAGLSTSELPKTHTELNGMIWRAYEIGTQHSQYKRLVRKVKHFLKELARRY